MKTKLLTIDGKKKSEVELPSCFSQKVREDIAQKYFEVNKEMQPYGPNPLAGKMHSDTGKIRHMRHKWKSAYGRGISRVPRKIFWRRGTQFYWQGSGISGTVGGRKAHPPRVIQFFTKKKINKKERRIAIASAFSSTTLSKYIKERYSSLQDKEIKLDFPLVVDSGILDLKAKEFFSALKKILNNLNTIAVQKKTIRAGRGKTRGRKYKKSAGLLLIIGNDEDYKITGIDVRKVKDIEIQDLWPLGRLTIYTEEAINDLNKIWKEEK